MKAAIFNPYLDTLGGGERYTMAVATSLIKNGYKVFIEWNEKSTLKKLENRFGIDLNDVELVPSIKNGDGYDLCFWLSDGSIPMLRSRNNLLHFQFPFKNVNGRTLINKMKFYRINHVICNSMFTKNIIDTEYGIKSSVLYPPVDTLNIKARRKENIILYVGRFSQLTQSKNQDVLIEAFKKLYDSGIRNYKLVLAGGVEIGVKDTYLKSLRDISKGYPVSIIESPTYSKLISLYGLSKLFWSASGYGVDEEVNPKGVEHFGITLVEAMSAGCIPFAYNAGGHKEIINHDNGFLWNNIDELIKSTKAVLKDKKLLEKTKAFCINSSDNYSYKTFDNEIQKYL